MSIKSCSEKLAGFARPCLIRILSVSWREKNQPPVVQYRMNTEEVMTFVKESASMICVGMCKMHRRRLDSRSSRSDRMPTRCTFSEGMPLMPVMSSKTFIASIALSHGTVRISWSDIHRRSLARGAYPYQAGKSSSVNRLQMTCATPTVDTMALVSECEVL